MYDFYSLQMYARDRCRSYCRPGGLPLALRAAVRRPARAAVLGGRSQQSGQDPAGPPRGAVTNISVPPDGRLSTASVPPSL